MSRNSARRNKQPEYDKQPQERTQQQPTTPPPSGVDLRPSFVVPTEFIDLPTQGKFYSEGNSLKNVEKVEIKYMTAREEDILVNQDYITRGIVLDKLVESILVDKSIKVADIGDVDKMALLVHARRTGYGSVYEMEGSCTNCNTEQVFVFDLDILIDNATKESINIPDDIEIDDETGTFSFDSPVSRYKVVCRVLNNEDFKYLADLEKQRKKHSLDFNYTIEFLRRIIVEIREPDSNTNSIPITDPEIISQFLEFIPALDSKKLKMTHSSLTPGFRMYQEVECLSCTAVSEREVPFSWAWFWDN